MSSSAPRPPEERRIIPLRPHLESPPAFPPQPRAGAASRDRADAARHYLKFMLPGIPVATFILTFVLCYVLVALPEGALIATHAEQHGVVDPSLPFLGALVLGLTTAALCAWIYFGYLRVSGADDSHHHHP